MHALVAMICIVRQSVILLLSAMARDWALQELWLLLMLDVIIL